MFLRKLAAIQKGLAKFQKLVIKPNWNTKSKYFCASVNQRLSQLPSDLKLTDDLSHEQLQYIKTLNEMNYRDLLREAKKYPGKPKYRTKGGILQFIVNSLAQVDSQEKFSGVKFSLIEKDLESELFSGRLLDEPMSDRVDETSFFEGDEKGANNDKFDLMEEESYMRTIDNMSRFFRKGVLRRYEGHILESAYKYIDLSDHFRPFIENACKLQQILTTKQANGLTLKMESGLFLQRCELFQSSSMIGKIVNSNHEEVKKMYFDIISLEGEYQRVTKNRLSGLVSEVKTNKASTKSLFLAVKALSDPLQFYSYFPMFKWNDNAFLFSVWRGLVSFMEVCNYQDMSTMLLALLNFRNKLRISSGDEAEVYENITSKIKTKLEENPNSYTFEQLTDILAYIKLARIPNTEKLEKNLEQLYKIFKEKYMTEITNSIIGERSDGSENILRRKTLITGERIFNLLYASTVTEENPPPIIVMDIFKKFIDNGIKFYNKSELFKLLQYLLSRNMIIDEKIADELKKNKKFFDDLNINEIYVFIEIFHQSKVDMASHYFYLYYAIGCLLDNLVASDFKTLLMITKIHHFTLSQKTKDHRRVGLEKRSNFIYNYVEENLHSMDVTDKISQIFYMSTLFNKYLNIPNFLFKKICENKECIVIDAESKEIYGNFVKVLLEKYQQHYSFLSEISSTEIDYNDKITNDAVEILEVLLKKFTESNFLSLHLLTFQVALNRELIDKIYKDLDSRRKFIESLLKQIPLISQKISALNIEHIDDLTQFLYLYSEELPSKDLIFSSLEKIFIKFIRMVNQEKPQFTLLLPTMYYFTGTLKKTALKEAEAGANMALVKQKSILEKRMREFFINYIQKILLENSKFNLSQIIYETGLWQLFNSNIFNDNFRNIEYVLPIMKNMDLEVFHSFENNFIGQLKRVSKMIKGSLLYENLILLDEFKIPAFDFYLLTMGNMSTWFSFYISSQEMILDKTILKSDQMILKLIEAFINQYERKPSSNGSPQETPNESNLQIFETPANKKFLTFTALAYKVFDHFSIKDHLKIFKIVGNNKANYIPEYIKKFNQAKFDIPSELEITLKSELPYFAQNKFLNESVNKKLEGMLKSFKNTRILLGIMKNERIWNTNMINRVNQEFTLSDSIFLNKELIEYFSICGVQLGHWDSIFNLIQRHNLSVFNETDLTNFLTTILAAKIRNVDLVKYTFSQYLIEPAYISQRPKKYDNILMSIVQKLLKSEFFYYFENIQHSNGKQVSVKYFKSFVMSEPVDNSKDVLFQLNVRNLREANDKNHSSSDPLFEEITTRMYETMQEGITSESKSYEIYRNESQKYFLFLEYAQKLDIVHSNVQLTESYLNSQKNYNNSLKSKDEYANFLIDFTLAFNTQNVNFSYKTNLLCENTKILIDIAIVPKKIAFLYLDNQQDAIHILDGGRLVSHTPDNLNVIKAYILETYGGWKVHLINYEMWLRKHDSKKKREEFIEFCLEGKI